MNARDAYSRLRYELAPAFVTTYGHCANGCGEYARGVGNEDEERQSHQPGRTRASGPRQWLARAR